MVFNQLDQQDQNVLRDVVAGKTDEEIMSAHGVDADKVSAIRGHAENNPEDVEAAKGDVPAEEVTTPSAPEGTGSPEVTAEGETTPEA